MKLVCPKCASRLKIPPDKVPPAGGWARCPKCSERFFVPGPGREVDLLAEHLGGAGAAANNYRRPPGRDAASQQLLNRLRKSGRGQAYGPGQREAGEAEVTIYPQVAPSPLIFRSVGLVFLLLPLIFMAVAFVKSGSKADVSDPTPAFNKLFNNEKDVELIRADLDNIKRKLLIQKKTNSLIRQSGAESRVFKYFAARLLAPGACDGISSLDLFADKPGRGFELTAVCVDGPVRRLKMEVAWHDGLALVRFPGYSKTDELDLYPPRSKRIVQSAAGK